jgi:hypothetical protein
MTDESVESGKNKNFGEHGRFVPGNTIGRMKKKGFTLADLNKLVYEYEKTHDLTLLKHYIERLYKNDKLLENYIEKNVPTKTINELTGAGGSPLTFIIEKTYENKEENGKTS